MENSWNSIQWWVKLTATVNSAAFVSDPGLMYVGSTNPSNGDDELFRVKFRFVSFACWLVRLRSDLNWLCDVKRFRVRSMKLLLWSLLKLLLWNCYLAIEDDWDDDTHPTGRKPRINRICLSAIVRFQSLSRLFKWNFLSKIERFVLEIQFMQLGGWEDFRTF